MQRYSIVWSSLFVLTLASVSQAAVADELEASDLQQLMRQEVSRDERLSTTVTSVGKHNQKLSETAAAVYVITQEDIRRSGATSIPDALRMVPGLDVARIDSNKWAISARGFNSRFSNKLLVLMDGREVYTPFFGGVYWEVQDTPLYDIDRIEVIRGPGASLWGANAVNGVVNIITKSAGETEGAHLRAGAGTYEKNFGSFRYGKRFDDETAGRVWASGFNRGSMQNVRGGNNRDAWDMARAGFRLDRNNQRDSALTLIGNAYSGTLGNNQSLTSTQPPNYYGIVHSSTETSGFNLLGRWKKALSLSSELSLQAYYDHTYRSEYLMTEQRDTFDLELQHRFVLGDSHTVNWGLGYRVMDDRFGRASIYLSAKIPRTTRQIFSLFVQDDIDLIPNTLTLTLGSKFQHNDYTGFEGQPSLRLLWRVNDRHTLWGSISRAVRTPSRADSDSKILTTVLPPNAISYHGLTNPVPGLAYALGNRNLASDDLLAYEIGYRFQPVSSFYLDIAGFYNDYTNLRGIDFSRPSYPTTFGATIPIYGSIENSMAAQSIGTEWLVHWQPLAPWTLDLSYSFVKTQFQSLHGQLNFSSEKGFTPQQQVSLRSSLDLGHDLDFDLWLRYVDPLPLHGSITSKSPIIPAYVTLDSRLAWRPYRGFELSLVGQNLLNDSHVETEQEIFSPPRTKIPRAMYFQVDWRF